MRAIHINPWSKSITEIDIEDDGENMTYDGLRSAVFPSRNRARGYIERVSLGRGISAWIDEEGILVNWDEQRFLNLHPLGQPRQGITLAGHVILTGDDDWGNTIALPASVTVENLRLMVQWLDAREVTVPGTKVYSVDEKTGQRRTEYDAGTWTYQNQPC